jgi:hypothetical protein
MFTFVHFLLFVLSTVHFEPAQSLLKPALCVPRNFRSIQSSLLTATNGEPEEAESKDDDIFWRPRTAKQSKYAPPPELGEKMNEKEYREYIFNAMKRAEQDRKKEQGNSIWLSFIIGNVFFFFVSLLSNAPQLQYFCDFG